MITTLLLEFFSYSTQCDGRLLQIKVFGKVLEYFKVRFRPESFNKTPF